MSPNDNSISNVVVAIVAIIAIIVIALYTIRLFQTQSTENNTSITSPPEVNITIPGTTTGNEDQQGDQNN